MVFFLKRERLTLWLFWCSGNAAPFSAGVKQTSQAAMQFVLGDEDDDDN